MSYDFEEKPEQSFTFEQAKELVRRRLWFFLVPLFVVWFAVWGISWVLPSMYRSSTLILVERPTVAPSIVAPTVTDSLQDRLQSISQQIQSRTRLAYIIESQNLYPQERQKKSADELVERMRKDIEVELVRTPGTEQLNAFNVSFSSRDPRVAQQVTSELTNLFITENLELTTKRSTDTTDFLESQLEDARKSLSEQEEKVRQFKDQHLGELPGQLQSNLQILSGLQNQLGEEQGALNRAKQQNVYLESLLSQYRMQQKSYGSSDKDSADVQDYDKELDRLRAQLADVSSHYTDRHPDVRKLKEQIARTEKMKAQAEASLKNTPAPASSDVTPVPGQPITPAVELESQLKVNRIEIANRERSIQDLRAQINEYQGRLNREPVREQQLTDLTRNYEQTKANYDSLLQKKNASQLATNLDLRQQGEHFRVLDPPSLPTKPYSPHRLKLSGIGLFAGLVLGALITGGAELLDDRLYNEKQFKDLLPVAIISEIPTVGTAEEQASQKKGILIGRLAAAMVLMFIVVGSAISYLHG
jgi:polysaccharide chain length determinant protein (PEP-CTERM system associated)